MQLELSLTMCYWCQPIKIDMSAFLFRYRRRLLPEFVARESRLKIRWIGHRVLKNRQAFARLRGKPIYDKKTRLLRTTVRIGFSDLLNGKDLNLLSFLAKLGSRMRDAKKS